MGELKDLLEERGYLYQCTDMDALEDLGSTTFYVGFDCTAKSLHVGSLVQIMLMRLLCSLGYKAIILMGDATTKIGDPSGRDKSRDMLSPDTIASNMHGIMADLAKFVNFDSVEVAQNSTWLESVTYIDMLQQVGGLFSVNRMLDLESIKTRIAREQNMSFLEFNYVIMQSIDFVELNRRYGCRVQIGGSDQWGNITSGVELGRKMGTDPLFGLTTPLIVTADGKKMGKSIGGAIWLNADMYSVYDYWQYFRNVDDADVGKFLRLFTDLPIEEIRRMEKSKGGELNEVKKILATEATAICHGNDKALSAQVAAVKSFEEGDDSGLPVFNMYKQEISLIKVLRNSGLVRSLGEARKLIDDRGCRVSGIEVNDLNLKLSSDSTKISAGKKRHIIVRKIRLEELLVVHHASTSIKESSIIITSIVVRSKDGKMLKFICDYAPESEKKMLQEFRDFVECNKGEHWLCWGMLGTDKFGFNAIIKRYKELFGSDFSELSNSVHDLKNILGEEFGRDIHLKEILKCNGLLNADFRVGEDEPKLFKEGLFSELQKSVISKVEGIYDLYAKYFDGTLTVE